MATSAVAPAATWRNARLQGRIAEIDGFRGLAIGMVLLFHYVGSIGAPNHPASLYVTGALRLFWSGVDLFFVLSGFLIAGILLDSRTSPTYFRAFYARRIHRIFPLYFIWLALFYLGIALNLDGRLHTNLFKTGTPLWLYPLFLQNNVPLAWVVKGTAWMGMSWSLAVEEQFYLVLPALVRFLNKSALGWLCALTLILSPVYRTLLVLRTPHLNPDWPFQTLSRLDGLAMGVGIALLVRNPKSWAWLQNHTGVLKLCALALLGVFIGLTRTSHDLSMAIYGFTAVSALFAVTLLLALCEPKSLPFLKARVFSYLGRISFAVYILHQGIRGLVDELLPSIGSNATRSIAVLFVALLVTLLLAELSWRMMESKLIRRAHVRYRY